LSGGEITGNTTFLEYIEYIYSIGGVYVYDGTFILGGASVISGNTTRLLLKSTPYRLSPRQRI